MVGRAFCFLHLGNQKCHTSLPANRQISPAWFSSNTRIGQDVRTSSSSQEVIVSIIETGYSQKASPQSIPASPNTPSFPDKKSHQNTSSNFPKTPSYSWGQNSKQLFTPIRTFQTPEIPQWVRPDQMHSAFRDLQEAALYLCQFSPAPLALRLPDLNSLCFVKR